MSVNSISSTSTVYSGSSGTTQNKLSEETKRKLQALGIDATNVTSEAQAQMLISAAQSRQQVQQANNDGSSQNTCSGETELISRARSLASEMGVSVSNDKSLSDIISLLSSKINAMSWQQEDNGLKTNEIQRFQTELSSLESEYSALNESQNSIFAAMNMTANLNKMMLGL